MYINVQIMWHPTKTEADSGGCEHAAKEQNLNHPNNGDSVQEAPPRTPTMNAIIVVVTMKCFSNGFIITGVFPLRNFVRAEKLAKRKQQRPLLPLSPPE